MLTFVALLVLFALTASDYCARDLWKEKALVDEILKYSDDDVDPRILIELGAEIIKEQRQRQSRDAVEDNPYVDLAEINRYCREALDMAKSVEIRNTTAMGLGVFAKRDIKKGERLFTVEPMDTIDGEDKQFDCFELSDLRPEMLKLAQLRLHAKPDSKFYTFLNYLPRRFPHFVWFTADDVELANNSIGNWIVSSATRDMYNEYALIWRHLLDNPQCSEATKLTVESYTLELHRWAYANTLSRTIAQQHENENTKTTVFRPCWDLINHSNTLVSGIVESELDDSFLVLSNHNIGTGEEILSTYFLEPTNSMKVFGGYGFVDNTLLETSLKLPNGTIIYDLNERLILLSAQRNPKTVKRFRKSFGCGVLASDQWIVLHDMLTESPIVTVESRKLTWDVLIDNIDSSIKRLDSVMPRVMVELHRTNYTPQRKLVLDRLESEWETLRILSIQAKQAMNTVSYIPKLTSFGLK